MYVAIDASVAISGLMATAARLPDCFTFQPVALIQLRPYNLHVCWHNFARL